METYQYERLTRPQDELGDIRLVRIRRGAAEENIRVAIQIVALKDIAAAHQTGKDKLVWYALSYTWGNLEDTDRVMVEVPYYGDEGVHSSIELKSLNVTQHLVEVLKELRSPDEDRIMWVDAICIDQATDAAALEERASQVKMMHQIYGQAPGVLIWLGPAADDSDYALHLLDELGSSINVDWVTFAVSTSSGQFSEPMKLWATEYGNRSSREYKALWALIGRSWFTRTWVRQEALLAAERSSVVVCGTQWMLLTRFRKAIHCLSILGLERKPFANIQAEDHRLVRAISICERIYTDEPNLMYRVRYSDCSDARDKVYGNLGIMNAIGDSRFAASIQVDYSPLNTVEKVYIDFFRRHHERYGTLRLLNEAGLRQGSQMRPTWVPDWRRWFTSLDLSMEAATSHFAQAECTFLDDGRLQVLGSSAVEVFEAHTLGIHDAHQHNVKWYRELISVMSRFGEDTNQETTIERFNYAICCALNNLRIDLSIAHEHRKAIRSYVQYLYMERRRSETELTAPSDILGEKAAWALEYCVRLLKQAQLPFVICEHGYVGIGPQGAKKGDIVTAVLGCRALMVLRPGETNSYQVVGPCFVHGLNSGEALLGSLPRRYTVVPHLEPSRNAYVPYYLNTDTEVSSMWDPRIVWEELLAHPPMVNFNLIPAPPGEPMRIRPNSNYLQRHGAKLKQFLLE